ncbi:MAG: AlpA family phage regulatory protein [Cellvibrionaceae bacterium]
MYHDEYIIPTTRLPTFKSIRDFRRRFNLTPRCVVWDLEEVETWIEAQTGIQIRKSNPRFGT